MHDLLTACAETSAFLFNNPSASPVAERLRKEKKFALAAQKIRDRLDVCGEVYAPPGEREKPPLNRAFTAVAWNIERGKHFSSLTHAFLHHPQLNSADLYFLTEVDWGMARTENRNVAAELGKLLGLYAYYAPSYYNFTKGHGTERHVPGRNELGLHGKAILSRYPLEELRSVPLPNATDKLTSMESRLGEKRALIGHWSIGKEKLAMACIHLDAFSSPLARSRQLEPAVLACVNESRVLLAGDFNTNTLNSCNGRTILFSIIRQLLSPGPSRLIREHHPRPERRFDSRLFKMIKKHGLGFEDYNEMGVGTYDLLPNDQELGQMASDKFPRWVLHWINRLLEKNGGKASLKLDWFAGKNLKCLKKSVLRLTPGEHFPQRERPSDHHPILLSFQIKNT